MNNTSEKNSSNSNPQAQRQQLLRTALLSAAVLLVAAFIGILFMLAANKLKPEPSAPAAVSAAKPLPLPEPATATNKQQLTKLRQEMRSQGIPCAEADLRLWAAEFSEPEQLFQVPPPEKGEAWNWHVAHGGLFAVAVSAQDDELNRRKVALYDLAQNKWLWQNRLLWPDSHSRPHVLGGHLLLRYSKNALSFALELDDAGQIICIDTLGRRRTEAVTRRLLIQRCPGLPAAIEQGVAFTVDQKTYALCGYAAARVPGLRQAGKGGDNTVFSGNGLLKFDAASGDIIVRDSLTQTILQRIKAWRDHPSTRVTGMRSNADGSHLSLFLTTEFAETPPVIRDWQINVDLYTGEKKTLFKPDSAAPGRQPNLQAISPDGRWAFKAADSNTLILSPADSDRVVAELPLNATGFSGPVSDIAFLEGGRHLRIRQGDNFWLLDFEIASNYAGLLARCAANASAPAASCAPPVPPNHSLLKQQQSHERPSPIDPDTLTHAREPNSQPASTLLLKAELLAANQVWGYAAETLEKVVALREHDIAAPGVNLLLLARCQILAGRSVKARETCLAALKKLIADPAPHNRMIRYHLQGLYFAEKL